MTVQRAMAQILDAPTINPLGTKRSDVVVEDVLCADGDFAAVKLASGKFAGVWPSHVDVVDTIEELGGDRTADPPIYPLLNNHERQCLHFKVNR